MYNISEYISDLSLNSVNPHLSWAIYNGFWKREYLSIYISHTYIYTQIKRDEKVDVWIYIYININYFKTEKICKWEKNV